MSVDADTDSTTIAGELRQRQVPTNVNDENDDGCEDIVTTPKARKTYGRTKDGTGKFRHMFRYRNV